MPSRRDLVVAVAGAPVLSIRGTFERHVGPQVRELQGSAAGGRWGAPGSYSVLYLGRPRDSIVVEAYRHLVEVSEGMTADNVGPRRCLRCEVNVSRVLDLRDPAALLSVGLSLSDLRSWDHSSCQHVGAVAHQLELHGVVAAAATGLGETLALFERYLTPEELPVLINDELWARLPPDPRALRVVSEFEADSH